ncbi:unnamed protein product [Effrenium voratum]|uniref:Translation initiation factor IF-3 n=1 Tax=Effrenium voratum TaxID=2562239 RepID=A0AA36ICR5_9DINO|nr:unnamed protein product [Effrenium voratum]CAJ1418613.1 unnamed protein product [Effrenium voratum]
MTSTPHPRAVNRGLIVLALGLALRSLCFAPPLWKPRASRTIRQAELGLDGREQKSQYKINEEIRATEVRVTGIADVEGLEQRRAAEKMEQKDQKKKQKGPQEKKKKSGAVMEDMNEIMLLDQAMEIARNKGLDVILISEDQDPPLVKIASVGKYTYTENKKKKKASTAKPPRMKEVKMSYTIEDHDLNTRLALVKKWVENNPRQQVKVQVVLKGRTRMFENQARQLLLRIQRDVAAYAKVPGIEKGNPAITKDGRGDLIMLLNGGADRSILKQLIEEAGGKKALQKQLAEAEVDKDEEEEDVEEEDQDEEVLKLEAEIEELKEELIECGISPRKVDSEPEMKELKQKLAKAEAKAAKVGA